MWSLLLIICSEAFLISAPPRPAVILFFVHSTDPIKPPGGSYRQSHFSPVCWIRASLTSSRGYLTVISGERGSLTHSPHPPMSVDRDSRVHLMRFIHATVFMQNEGASSACVFASLSVSRVIIAEWMRFVTFKDSWLYWERNSLSKELTGRAAIYPNTCGLFKAYTPHYTYKVSLDTEALTLQT